MEYIEDKNTRSELNYLKGQLEGTQSILNFLALTLIKESKNNNLDLFKGDWIDNNKTFKRKSPSTNVDYLKGFETSIEDHLSALSQFTE